MTTTADNQTYNWLEKTQKKLTLKEVKYHFEGNPPKHTITNTEINTHHTGWATINRTVSESR